MYVIWIRNNAFNYTFTIIFPINFMKNYSYKKNIFWYYEMEKIN